MSGSTAAAWAYAPFDAIHGPNSVLILTLKVGPNAGRTSVDCTCGWRHTYKSRAKAQKRVAEHLVMNGVTG